MNISQILLRKPDTHPQLSHVYTYQHSIRLLLQYSITIAYHDGLSSLIRDLNPPANSTTFMSHTILLAKLQKKSYICKRMREFLQKFSKFYDFYYLLLVFVSRPSPAHRSVEDSVPILWFINLPFGRVVTTIYFRI